MHNSLKILRIDRRPEAARHITERLQRTVPDEQGCVYRGVLLDQGVVDLLEILKKLREYDYQGDFLIEYQGEEDPRYAMRQDVAHARGLLEEAGFDDR